MKTTLKIFAMLALLCSLAGSASAQIGCITPHFSEFVSQTATFPANTTDPTGSTAIHLTQTVSVAGYSSLTSTCQTMVNTSVHHYVTNHNLLKKNGVTYGSTSNSAQSCATCSFNYITPAFLDTNGDDPFPTESDTGYDLMCTQAGRFSGGSIVFKFIRLLRGSSVPDHVYANTNCVTGATNTVCDQPVKPWCTISNPAVAPTEIRAMTAPFQAQWWTSWDICVRITPDNSTPWVCPTWHTAVPYGITNIPIGLPLALDRFSPPPPLGDYCDSRYKP